MEVQEMESRDCANRGNEYITEEIRYPVPSINISELEYKLFNGKKFYKTVFEDYWVSTDGEILSTKFKKPRIAKIEKTFKHGYFDFSVYKNNKRKHILIHNLVTLTFIGERPNDGRKWEVDHINNIKTDNRIENLRYVLKVDNTRKSTAGKYHHDAIKTIAEIDGVIKRFDTVKDFCDYIDIARKSFYFDFQRGKNSKNWKLLSYNRYGDKGQETIEIRIARK